MLNSKLNILIGIFFLILFSSMALANPQTGTFDGLNPHSVISNATYPINVQLPHGFNASHSCNGSISELEDLTNLTGTVQFNFTSNESSSGGVTDVTNRTVVLNTFAFEDGNRYNISVICVNATASRYEFNNLTRIQINNTKPVIPTNLLSGKITNRTVAITASVIGANVTSCSITFTDGKSPVSVPGTTTHSGSGCSLPLSNPSEGAYSFEVLASDGNDTAISSGSITLDYKQGSAGYVTPSGVPIQKIQQAGAGQNLLFIMGIGILILGSLTSLAIFMLSRASRR